MTDFAINDKMCGIVHDAIARFGIKTGVVPASDDVTYVIDAIKAMRPTHNDISLDWDHRFVDSLFE